MLGSTRGYATSHGTVHPEESDYVLKIGFNFSAHRYSITQFC